MSDEFAFLDATAQAELVRRGDVTPAELVDAAIERIEAVNPQLNAVIIPLYDKARAAAAGDLPDGPFRGVPFLLKDAVAHSAGDPYHCGMQVLKDAGLDGARRHVARAALPRRRLRHRRQDEPARARDVGDHRAARVRRDAQPVEPRPLTGRFQRRRRRRGRLGHGAGRARQRHGRLDPDPRERVRARRAQAVAGTQHARTGFRRVLGDDDARARADTLGARHRGRARRDRRPRRRRPVLRAPAGPAVRAGGRCRPRSPAHRLPHPPARRERGPSRLRRRRARDRRAPRIARPRRRAGRDPRARRHGLRGGDHRHLRRVHPHRPRALEPQARTRAQAVRPRSVEPGHVRDGRRRHRRPVRDRDRTRAGVRAGRGAVVGGRLGRAGDAAAHDDPAARSATSRPTTTRWTTSRASAA